MVNGWTTLKFFETYTGYIVIFETLKVGLKKVSNLDFQKIGIYSIKYFSGLTFHLIELMGLTQNYYYFF
jgi:hypothetical protein